MTHRVAVLALDGVIPFDLAIPARVLGAALDARGEPLYEVLTCAIGGGQVRTNADFSIHVDHDESILAAADTVVVATQEPSGRLLEEGRLEDEVAAAMALIGPGTRIVSICTGSFVLAAAGLLDGLSATTHWAWSRRFAALFPQVRLEPDVLFVDNGRLLTSAGAASGVDLCLHLIRRDHGAAVANRAARSCVVPPWREGGQAQFVERPVPADPASSTAPVRAWMLEHLDREHPLPELAERAHMSVRTFTRRFRDETGTSPSRWLTRQRVKLARDLLERTDAPIEEVARRAGFGSGQLLRHHMLEVLRVGPAAYRRTFRGPTPADEEPAPAS